MHSSREVCWEDVFIKYELPIYMQESVKRCRSLLVESKRQSFQHRRKIKPFLHDRDASYTYRYYEGMLEAKPVEFNLS